MTLNNLLGKAKNGIAGVALGMAMAVTPMSGCGEECPQEVVYKDSVGGVYNCEFSTLEKNPPGIIAPEDEQGPLDIPVLPLDNVGEHIEMGIFTYQKYVRDTDNGGHVDESWNNIYSGVQYRVNGHIRDNGKLDLEATVDGVDFITKEPFHIKYRIQGDKQTVYPEEIEKMAPAQLPDPSKSR
ncbi:hypothetical protein GOV03_01080 [Candidatus Woesearchaeota archaeon]|nr:hypothetical protein [Candidatus Woesearchaeota archaeon]